MVKIKIPTLSIKPRSLLPSASSFDAPNLKKATSFDAPSLKKATPPSSRSSLGNLSPDGTLRGSAPDINLKGRQLTGLPPGVPSKSVSTGDFRQKTKAKPEFMDKAKQQMKSKGVDIDNPKVKQRLSELDTPDRGAKKLTKKEIGELQDLSKKKLSFDGAVDYVKKNWKTLAASAVALTLTAVAISAQATTDQINNTGYTITTIQKDPRDSKIINITYTPGDVFTKDDTITITNTNSSPSVDNIYNGNILNPKAGVFSLRLQNELKMNGNKGTFTVITEFSDQFSKGITDATAPVLETAGSITEELVSQTADTAVGAFGGIFDAVFPGLGEYTWLISLLCVLILCSSSSLVFGVFVKKNL